MARPVQPAIARGSFGIAGCSFRKTMKNGLQALCVSQLASRLEVQVLKFRGKRREAKQCE